ncbi:MULTISPECIES: hypothetical protein [unclassified Streptomyces]|uniref:hypothetical protein n=1 Tax=unclassified Streptomyces TaxID=2593676 RepID=UPI00225BA5F0|nr:MULTISPECIES: hypothetical protein [unclassified Streptomyces]WSP59628.1 hypothetical protein OG306_38790 [Streptomyces sp. NBC_01241]WSU19852.1 hypothetical protein OG508_01570 [Streptomyces sp. NBC_01108]MCX4791399.1 hypothetical protein [Streptomyces sp. NBC_01221]MCX4792860.1 hypothetical protein [Streptomyces sp. NBC_01242]WSP60776.1 hypothetical protein OG466_01645 [Streptomyces sp. NBC_01240]
MPRTRVRGTPHAHTHNPGHGVSAPCPGARGVQTRSRSRSGSSSDDAGAGADAGPAFDSAPGWLHASARALAEALPNSRHHALPDQDIAVPAALAPELKTFYAG